jgi:hypothetical protein
MPAPAQSSHDAAIAKPAVKAAAEAKAVDHALDFNASASLQSLPPGFIDSLRGAAGLAADVSSIKQVLGGAAALAAHAKVSQQQLDDNGIIQGRPELVLFYGAVCQGLQCMLHIATAFKTGSVQLDKNSSFGGYLGQVSDHYDDAVDAMDKAASHASDLAARAGSFEGAANAMASVLDKVADIADGIPVASFVLKGLSFIVNQVQGLKFDARMNRMIKSLFPDLSPLAWTYVVEEVARRVAVLCAAEIQALHRDTGDRRGRMKNWFRMKCSDYGLATLTTKAEDAVVMMALQNVDCVSQLALSDSVPESLSGNELADFIVRHLVLSAPDLAPVQASAVPFVQSSSASPDIALSPPSVALYDAKSHSELELLQEATKKLVQAQAEQEERDKRLEQEVAAVRKEMRQLAPQDKDKGTSGSGGGLVVISSKSEVNAETVNTAAAQAVLPVQQQVVRIEHQVQELQELTAFIMSHSDPVLNTYITKLTNFAIPVMKKHDDISGWQQRFVAVRGRWLCYGRSYDAAVQLANSLPHHDASDEHVVNLVGCSACLAPQHDDSDHSAFTLTASGGLSLLLSHRETACAVAIMEVISRCSAPPTASAAPSSSQNQGADADERRNLLSKYDVARVNWS